MNVKQIREIEPLAEVYELNPERRYIIRLPQETPKEAAQRCCELVNEMGCRTLVFRTKNKAEIFQYVEKYEETKYDEKENQHE